MFFLEYKNKLIGGILAACMMLTALTSAGSAVIAADDGFESVAAGHYFGAELLPSGVDADTLHRRLSDAVSPALPQPSWLISVLPTTVRAPLRR